MDLEIVLSEVSQIQEDKYHRTSVIYGILKKDANKVSYKTEVESQV